MGTSFRSRRASSGSSTASEPTSRVTSRDSLEWRACSKATAFGTVMIKICFLGYLLYHWLMLPLNNDDQSEISCFLRQLKPFQNFPESWSPDRLLYNFLKLLLCA